MGESLPPQIRFPNTGNSCYMNAALHFLFSVPRVLSRLSDTTESHFILDYLSDKDAFMTELYHLAKIYEDPTRLEYSNTKIIHKRHQMSIPGCLAFNTSAFQKQANKGHPDFSKSGMEDAMEYFLYLTSLIKDSYAAAMAKYNSRPLPYHLEELDLVPNADPCVEGFRVILNEIVNRQGSMTVTDREEYVLSVPLLPCRNAEVSSLAGGGASSDGVPQEQPQLQELSLWEKLRQHLHELSSSSSEEEADDTPPSDVNLEDCLSAFFQTDQVLNEKNVSIEKTSYIATFPPSLVIQLRRFAINDHGSAIKLGDRVDAPREIDFGQWSYSNRVLGHTKHKEQYTLRAFVVHQSATLTASCGHYVTYVWHPDQHEWYMYDDARVRRLKQAPTDQGYFYLYSKPEKESHP